MNCVGYIPLERFELNFEGGVPALILHLISIRLHLTHKDSLFFDSKNTNVVEVKSVKTSLHNGGTFCGVRFEVEFGRGYKIPRIIYHAESEQ